jgi:uncharacterized RDD family membrane protein YckC
MASRTTRFFARLFDCCILTAIMMPSILLSGSPEHFFGEGLIFQVSTVIFFLYFFFSDVFNGQSIGKRLMRIGVIDANSRRPGNLFQLLVRNTSIVVFSVLDMLMMMDKSKLRLGDRLAGTAVVLEQNLYRW